jgi:GNAT superfamily N-acetyltransferase
MSDIRLAATQDEIRRCFAVMLELRPHLKSEDEFVARVLRQQAGQNWKLAYIEEDGQPVALAGFRIHECMSGGKLLYVDDLVTRQDRRSRGLGEKLMAFLERTAREAGCDALSLDSGTRRIGAHKFYMRLGLPITAFHFTKKL